MTSLTCKWILLESLTPYDVSHLQASFHVSTWHPGKFHVAYLTSCQFPRVYLTSRQVPRGLTDLSIPTWRIWPPCTFLTSRQVPVGHSVHLATPPLPGTFRHVPHNPILPSWSPISPPFRRVLRDLPDLKGSPTWPDWPPYKSDVTYLISSEFYMPYLTYRKVPRDLSDLGASSSWPLWPIWTQGKFLVTIWFPGELHISYLTFRQVPR
jgi:hypothetical protein